VDFTNKNLAVLFKWGDTTVYLTETILNTWIVMGALILLTIVVRIKMRKFKGAPTGLQNLIELAVEMMGSFAGETLGEELKLIHGYFFGVFAFIITSNYSGMLGFRPPTADLATTAALGLMTFFISHSLGVARLKLKYLKAFIEPLPVFLPINIVGKLAEPVSLAFRLFGNLVSGFILMGLVYNLFPLILRFVVPAPLHAFFDLFAGALQAYVFTVLSMSFIRQTAVGEG